MQAARPQILAAELAAGRLVEPCDLEVPLESGYYLITPEIRAEQPKIAL